MYSCDDVTAVVPSVLECITRDPLRCLECDQLDGLHDARDDLCLCQPVYRSSNRLTATHLVLYARVFAFRILTDDHRVDINVGRLEALNRPTWSHIGKQAECPSKRQVERNMTFADWRCERPLERYRVALDRIYRHLRDD